MYVVYTNSCSIRFFVLLNSYVCRLSKILSVWIFWHVMIFRHVTQFGPKASETISQRRFLPKLFICKRKIHHKGRKRFFPTVSIRSESNRNDFSEKVFVQIKMIHISILSYSLNSVRKRLKQFLEKVFVKITQFRVCPSSVSIDYTLLLGARRSCGQFKTNFCIFLLSPSPILSKPPNMMPITLLVARRIQCSYNHDKSPRIDRNCDVLPKVE